MPNLYQVQVTYIDQEGWEVCRTMTSQDTEDKAFRLGQLFIDANQFAQAEIMVLPPNSEFWKVRDSQGRTKQRRVTHA